MMSPSDDEKRIVAMVDSFTKTVARNFSRNLKRAKANREKHFSDEPIDYLIFAVSLTFSNGTENGWRNITAQKIRQINRAAFCHPEKSTMQSSLVLARGKPTENFTAGTSIEPLQKP